MLADVFRPAGIVEKNCEVECVGVLDLNQELPVARNRGVIGFDQGIELINAAQGMLCLLYTSDAADDLL